MQFQELLNHRVVTGAGIGLAQVMPRPVGYGLAQVAATAICRLQPALYHVVRNNLQQVLGAEVDEAVLEAKTRTLFVHAGRTNYEFFNAVNRSPEEVRRLVSFPNETIALIHSAAAEGRGVLLLGAHIGNFNLGILALAAVVNEPIQALSVAAPNEGFTLLNTLRTRWGLEVTPISPLSLRQAIRRLEGGGIVMTAFDFPVRESSELIPFFGKPAYFPLGPARLARMANPLVLMGSTHYDPVHGYVVHTQTIDIERTQNRRQDVRVNARRMAKILEGYVAQYPEQWLMFYPFWPEGDEEAVQQTASSIQAASS